MEARAIGEGSPAVISLLHQLNEVDGELGPLRVIEKAGLNPANKTTVTVADTIIILRFCPNDAVSLVQRVDPQEETSAAKGLLRRLRDVKKFAQQLLKAAELIEPSSIRFLTYPPSLPFCLV